jgi:hypothetical protein
VGSQLHLLGLTKIAEKIPRIAEGVGIGYVNRSVLQTGFVKHAYPPHVSRQNSLSGIVSLLSSNVRGKQLSLSAAKKTYFNSVSSIFSDFLVF